MTAEQIRARLNRYRREIVSRETRIPIRRLRSLSKAGVFTFDEGLELGALFKAWEAE